MVSDRARWDDRYAGHPAPVPTVPEALAGADDLVGLVPDRGRALDVACGSGGQAWWLAARGLDVVGLDVSPKAIELLRDAAERAGWSARVDARVHDLDHGLPDGLGRFDVVLCQRFRDPKLYPVLIDALGVGGIGIVTVLSAVGTDGDPGPFHAPAGELVNAFTTACTEVLADAEADGLASIVFRRTGLRP